MSFPLKGLKVLDFSSLLPGPYASMMLSDMGAEVLRMQSPSHPDLLSTVAPFFVDGDQQQSYAYLTINRNKRSMALDLKKPECIEVIKQLVQQYDIVLEQFRPGVMQKLGLDYDTLKAINPGLIYCSITGYGQTGPCKDKAGHDINYLALSGLASYSGTADSGPVLSGTQIADIAGGSNQAVISILAAVLARQNNGAGQYLDVSMTDAAFALNAMFAAGALGSGDSPQPGGTMLNGGSFYGYYQTLDNRHLAVGGLEPKFIAAFFDLMGHNEWMALLEAGDHQQLKQQISSVIAKQNLSFWQAKFAKSDVCVEPVLTVIEAAQSDLMQHRGMVIDARVTCSNGKKNGTKTVRQVAPVVKFSDEQIQITTGGSVGADTHDVLTELGYSEEQIKQIIGDSHVR
ncbi:MAG: CoA transferase [Algicola sp.]|nr:CoA transferase [Algicola sp.]